MANSFIDFSLNISKKEYLEMNALSASLLSAFSEQGTRVFQPKEPRASLALNFGDALDTYIFDTEEFSDHFIVVNQRFTGQLLLLYNYVKDVFFDVEKRLPTTEELEGASIKMELWGNIKDRDKRREKFDTEEFWDEVSLIPMIKEKNILTEEEFQNIKLAAIALRTHQETFEALFSDDKVRYNHIKFCQPIQNYFVKGEMDQLVVDDKNKEIIIVDLKSGEAHYTNFKKQFYDYKYWIQATVYYLLLKEVLKELPQYEDYTVKFQFVYVSKTGFSTTVVYDLDPKWFALGEHGWINIYGDHIKGIYELINEYMWHIDHQLTTYPREVYENSNHFLLKIPAYLE